MIQLRQPFQHTLFQYFVVACVSSAVLTSAQPLQQGPGPIDMRIACLQFAPQVGDVDNNLNRADAVLARANQYDVDTLDLLVLPELAFSGHNFQSLQEIAPYLEPPGSGITSLWARTIALKHNTSVVVGYPEKNEVSGNLRGGPEYFNSTILVNSDGETVMNYRKTFLHPQDETWACEGTEFFGGHISGLGNTAIGICTDISPYRLQAPWHAFEFAFHILEVRANLVIVTMAWLTGEDCEHFTQFSNEPDMEALTYWAQRLEPVIRDESRDEVIEVFCNRSGIEGDMVYSGTSAVIGIHQGEVKVYGVLGRGVKKLLMVDTDDPPLANLIIRQKKAYLSPTQYERKESGQGSNTDGRPLSNPSQPLEFPDNKCLKLPADGTYESKSYGQRASSPKSEESLPLSATSDRNDRACKLSNPPNFGNCVPTRPSTATGVVPPRPSSPKSRTASRSGCHRRHRSEAEQRETGPVFDCLEFLQPQSRSVSAQYQDHRSSLIKEIIKSPISRGATRLGRQLNLDQGFVERALEFYLRSMPIDSRDVALAASSYRRRPDILAKEHDSFQHTSVRTSLGSRHYSSLDSGRTSSCTRASPTYATAAKPQFEPDQSRTAVWMEISKLVRDRLGRSESEESTRGQLRSRSGSSTEASRASGGTAPATRLTYSQTKQANTRMRSCSVDSTCAQRGSRSTSSATPMTSSQTRQGAGRAIRSVRDPSLGPPSDPEDEIIAEITLRYPCCTTCSSTSSSDGITSTPSKVFGSRAPVRNT